jgi:sortase (surface protein transpeptidase)
MSKHLLLSLLAALALAAAALAPVAGAQQSGYYSPLIVIPALGVHQDAQRTLATGPIVYYDNQATGTIGIAGHNVTPVAGYNGHGPFHFLKFMKVGEDVYVNHVHYRVVRKITALPTEAKQLLNFRGVVLSACYPDHSAAYRTVVFAAPVS